jgi:exopolysaccharide biosynthesis polyprenyl glycosylphosphotransferase
VKDRKMTLPSCHLFLLNLCIVSLPSFAFEIWQHVWLDNLWFPLRDSAIAQSYFIPILLSELVWTLAVAYCKFSMIHQIATVPPKRHSQFPYVVEDIQSLGESTHGAARVRPRTFPTRYDAIIPLQKVKLPVLPVESFGYTVMKRIFDLVASLFGVIVVSPLLLLIAILVKLSSPGPVFFCQERVGRHGKVFTMVKFRTMFLSSRHESDTLWTTNGDSRVTRLGAVLRRFSLDELPQLFNVVRGDMSLVGPRPERPYFVAKFRENFQKYNMRHCCHVGITGWAQVNGLRGDTSISERLQYDLGYIRNWTFVLDLRILVRTALVVLTDQNGY